MLTISRPQVTVTGTAKPERVYVAIQTGTAVIASSDRITVRMPGQRPDVVEVRENTAGTVSGFAATCLTDFGPS